ncbi:ATP-binding protein [Bythopirellula goksoeyrii]|uniref:Uncharacterized protein n=1 Tax=Bythopirellula goksoeyrii TaxID=1400387 RepID=A0A5B9QKX9_9BACT|nr:AAA family ATPase [Bythopirellula goksoeyrii]QEG37696.1 hypothetical protein Pr1d_50420 [Bythopirellula goksoeyrii]
MSKTLTEIAQQLKEADKKVQLIYAFNGTGKTRLSREFKDLIAPKNDTDEEEAGLSRDKILYYNAFTEDLFHWDNDLEEDIEKKLRIQPNTFTDWILLEQGQDQNVVANFQRLTNKQLTPSFNQHYRVVDGRRTYHIRDVTFSIETGDEDGTESIKISKGEESVFVWSVFYTILEEVVDVLSVPEAGDRGTNQFDNLEYVFIDDPVSSLDDSHLIELAQRLAALIKLSPQDGPKFVITTHNPLFFNVLFNAIKKGLKYRLTYNEDGTFSLEPLRTDSPFSYHLHLLEKLRLASEQNGFEKYHYNFLRNILEKTSTFLGYDDWADLLPRTAEGTSDPYLKRIIDISSHSKHSGYELSELSQDDKRVLKFLLTDAANKQYVFPEKYRMALEEDHPNG